MFTPARIEKLSRMDQARIAQNRKKTAQILGIDLEKESEKEAPAEKQILPELFVTLVPTRGSTTSYLCGTKGKNLLISDQDGTQAWDVDIRNGRPDFPRMDALPRWEQQLLLDIGKDVLDLYQRCTEAGDNEISEENDFLIEN